MTARRAPLAAQAALAPAWAMVAAYALAAAWSIWMSLTRSGAMPDNSFAGLHQYRRLFSDGRWQVSMENLAVFGVLFVAGSLVLGALLAFAIDRMARGQNLLRTLFLYPYAMSFIVTGLAWQWLMNPTLGIQVSMRFLGWESFAFDWTARAGTALYALVLAGVWQASGLVATIVLAGLRGIDPDIRKAARVDGVPAGRFDLSVALPMLRPSLAACAFMLSVGAVKTYDLVVALTHGGPGLATQMPSLYVIDYLFQRGNIGLAMAASTVMLVAAIAAAAPFVHVGRLRARRAEWP